LESTKTEMSQALWSVIWNVLGGVIVALLTLATHWTVGKFKHRAFKQVFGKDLGDFYIIYPSYEPPTKETTFLKPPSRVPRPAIITANLTTVNSNAATRSVSHLAYVIGNYSPSLPLIRSDVEMDKHMDLSFLSVGGLNNYKSLDILENTSNVFLQFGHDCIESKTLKKCIVKIEGQMDFGFILKIHPSNNPKRTWLCVAGIGEWGTSGASWWLSRHWKTVQKRAKDKPFACITKTRYESDDSTSLVHLFLSRGDIENMVEKTPNKPIGWPA
jgi:hypothetical protein